MPCKNGPDIRRGIFLSVIPLRDYQSEIVTETISALRLHSRVVVACPTGSGKTVIAMHGLIPLLTGRKAWVTHRTELARQAREYGQDIDVFMAQSPITGNYDAIIIDEGHHVCASRYREIISQFPSAKIIALTATPYRLDGVGLGSCGFTKIIHGPDTYDLTENGMLCRVRVFIPASEDTVAWTPEAAAQKISEVQFKKGIAFCRSVGEAECLAKLLKKLGVSSASIDGTTDAETRRKVFRSFSFGRLRVICNHTIFTEGVDVPDVDLVVLNRHTMSRCLWKQMIGRGTRNSPGKAECLVLDLAGNGVVHGSIYDREIYDLHGSVESTQSRELAESLENNNERTYNHNQGEQLKEWKPQPKPVRILENLRQLKSRSPLHRFMTVSAD